MKRVARNRTGETKSTDLDHQQTASSPSSFAGAMARQAANKEQKDEASLLDDSSLRAIEKEDADR
jgi:hypothetical protein